MTAINAQQSEPPDPLDRLYEAIVEFAATPFDSDGWQAAREEVKAASSGVNAFLQATSRPPLVAANDNGGNTPAFVDPAAWEGVPVPVRPWYVPGLIPSRTVTLLSGDGGLGKSLFAVQLGIAGALGIETLGLSPSPGRVLYVGAEDEVDEFHRRIADILTASGRTFAELDGQFLLLPLAEQDATLAAPGAGGKMLPTPLMADLTAKVDAFRPSLVVLDTSADLFGGDEIKRSQVRQFVAMLRAIALKGDCAVLLLSHPSVAGMQTGTGTSGSTAWNNSVRSRLYLTAPTGEDADPDSRLLSTMKSNYGPKGDELRLRWQAGAFVPDDGGKPNPAAALLASHCEKVFVDLLRKLTRQGQRVSPSPSQSFAPRVMMLQPEGKGYTKRQLSEAQQRLLDKGTIRIVEEGPNSRRYKRLVIVAEDFSPGASN